MSTQPERVEVVYILPFRRSHQLTDGRNQLEYGANVKTIESLPVENNFSKRASSLTSIFAQGAVPLSSLDLEKPARATAC